MEDTKLQEMEEEIKVLKAQIHGVLLDIRETILERTNPLENGGETASIRMDLRTTASAMAAEAAAHEARGAMDQAEGTAAPAPLQSGEGLPAELDGEPLPPSLLSEAEEPESPALTAVEDAAPADDLALTEDEGETGEEPEEAPPPKVIRREARELKMLAEEREREQAPERVEIPPAYRAEIAPLSGNGSLSAWLTHALDAVGPQGTSRIIAAHRAWGHLPPNLSRALAYVQEMLDDTEDTDPPWLHVMQELDELASL